MKTQQTILLFGFTRSTAEIARELRSKNYTFQIVDNDAHALEEARKKGFDITVLDYTDDDMLYQLGVGHTVSFVFALFEEDAKNVFLTLSIKSIDENIPVIAITHTKDAIHKLHIAGASTILDPYQISGKKIYKLITQPEVMSIIDATVFGYHNITMDQITISETSSLNGCRINDISPSSQHNVILLGIHDKELKREFIFITEGHNHKLDTGDILVVIGESEAIERYKIDYNL